MDISLIRLSEIIEDRFIALSNCCNSTTERIKDQFYCSNCKNKCKMSLETLKERERF